MKSVRWVQKETKAEMIYETNMFLALNESKTGEEYSNNDRQTETDRQAVSFLQYYYRA